LVDGAENVAFFPGLNRIKSSRQERRQSLQDVFSAQMPRGGGDEDHRARVRTRYHIAAPARENDIKSGRTYLLEDTLIFGVKPGRESRPDCPAGKRGSLSKEGPAARATNHAHNMSADFCGRRRLENRIHHSWKRATDRTRDTLGGHHPRHIASFTLPHSALYLYPPFSRLFSWDTNTRTRRLIPLPPHTPFRLQSRNRKKGGKAPTTTIKLFHRCDPSRQPRRLNNERPALTSWRSIQNFPGSHTRHTKYLGKSASLNHDSGAMPVSRRRKTVRSGLCLYRFAYVAQCCLGGMGSAQQEGPRGRDVLFRLEHFFSLSNYSSRELSRTRAVSSAV
ncbi:hypothetical protein CTA2_1495, partial [Colletotrichum tanaceti]